VSSDLPQVRSAFGDDVEYVESGDTNGFSDQICSELNRSSDVALDSAFQWERTVEETTVTLQTLVSESL